MSGVNSGIPELIVAVGTDGFRPVVWGLGVDEDDALNDACHWLGSGSARTLASLTTHTITEAQADVVRSGDVSWPIVVSE